MHYCISSDAPTFLLLPSTQQVKETLRYWMNFYFNRVAANLRDMFEVNDLAGATLSQIGRGALGRTNTDPG